MGDDGNIAAAADDDDDDDEDQTPLDRRQTGVVIQYIHVWPSE